MNRMLRSILSTADKVSKVVITHRCRQKVTTESTLKKYCQWKTCPISATKHTMFRPPDPGAPWSHRPSFLADINKALLGVIGSSRQKIKALMMERCEGSRGHAEFPYDTICLLTNMAHMPRTRLFLGNLRKLHVRHVLECDSVHSRESLVGEFLACAQNLNVLSLQIFTHDYGMDSKFASTFQRIFYGCRFPELRVLMLEGMEMRGDELLRLLKNSPALQYLALDRISLNGYLWSDLIDRLKSGMNLKDLSINNIRGYFKIPPGIWEQYYIECNDDVSGFIQGRKDKPFIDVAIARHFENTTMEERYSSCSRRKLLQWSDTFS